MTKLDEKWALTAETVGADGLSVILPLYQLSSTVEENILEVADLLERHGVKSEIVPVDDGSGDGTDGILSRFQGGEYHGETIRTYAYITFVPVVCRKNSGKGAALRAGFAASTGRYVMLLDGDLDIHPKQTPYFFEEMVTKAADIVIGSKRHPRSAVQYPWHRRIVSACYFTFVRLFFGLKVTDTQTGMKLFKRETLGYALDRMLVKTYAFDLELLSIAVQHGAKIA